MRMREAEEGCLCIASDGRVLVREGRQCDDMGRSIF